MSDNRQLFLLGQKLFRLKNGLSEAKPLSADERKGHVCAMGLEGNAWDATPREILCAEIISDMPPHRAALVCNAGIGKTTNMQYLQAKLADARGRQLPLMLNLQDKADQLLLEWERTPGHPSEALVNRLAQLIDDQADQERLKSAIRRMQAAGRITLLIDGLDHVADTSHTAGMIDEMLETEQWRKCPAWIAGRPTAFESAWQHVFVNERWQFYRVNELDEPEIRFYMSANAGGDWYDEFTDGKDLLRIPRLLHLICFILREAVADKKTHEERLAAVRELQFRTAADVYYRAFFYIGPHDDPNRQGLLAQGLQGDATWIGLDKNVGFTPHKENRLERVNRAAAILGAIAFEMLDMSDDKANPKPEFGSVLLGPFKPYVANRMVAAGQGTHGDFDRDFKLLKEMNIHTLDHLLFREASEERLSFHNRTTQAFFAAYWACRHARLEGGSSELDVTRWWLVDDLFEMNQEFREFWGFSAELHEKCLPQRKDGAVDERRWLALFTPLYDGSIKDEKEHPIRSTEAIYRSWLRMDASEAGRKIIADNYRVKSMPKELRVGFIRLMINSVLKNDSGAFTMGDGNETCLVAFNKPFYLHKFCVTNLQYELFDPRHSGRRWLQIEEHRAVKKTGNHNADDECPVVNVSWYDAVSYCRWLGAIADADGVRYEIDLPTEAQWEYACRAGRERMDYTFDARHDGKACTTEYCNYNGQETWGGHVAGTNRECTITVDGSGWEELGIPGIREPNLWGFYQLHGNVWEWVRGLV